MNDSLGDRMKQYEAAEAGRRLMPLLPALARLDGRAFHSFVRGLARPFDKRLSDLMIDTATFLVRETNAAIGYTQSDEITLAWVPEEYDAQIFFDGRIQKMTSMLAALCSAHFNRRLPAFLPAEFAERLPVFDCRVWNVPTLEEAANTFLWRELDATKNSISMAARAYYDHAELHDKSGSRDAGAAVEEGRELERLPGVLQTGHVRAAAEGVARVHRDGTGGTAAEARGAEQPGAGGGAVRVRSARPAAAVEGGEPGGGVVSR